MVQVSTKGYHELLILVFSYRLWRTDGITGLLYINPPRQPVQYQGDVILNVIRLR